MSLCVNEHLLRLLKGHLRYKIHHLGLSSYICYICHLRIHSLTLIEIHLLLLIHCILGRTLMRDAVIIRVLYELIRGLYLATVILLIFEVVNNFNCSFRIS